MVVSAMNQHEGKNAKGKHKLQDDSTQSKAKRSKRNTESKEQEDLSDKKTDGINNKADRKSRESKVSGTKKTFNKQKKIIIEKKGEQSSKPNWMEFKKEKKELKEKRKAQRLSDTYEISAKVKKISEKFRRTDCSDSERKKLVGEAHTLLKNHYDKLIFSHDVSRIVQWIFKYSTQEMQTGIFHELQPCLVLMMQSKYAKNCVKIMVEHSSPEIKSQIVSACYGHIVKLISSTISAPLLEYIYANGTTYIEKAFFKQEFYSDIYKQSKDKSVKKLSDTYNTAIEMKSGILSAVKGNLLKILNKKLIKSTLIHHVLWEFLNECSTEDRNELIVMLRESLSELSQTKYGAKVGVMCMWHGTNKDKKIMMKALKDNVKSVCISEHGYNILLALFDSVDDTVLVKKIIISEIEKDLTEIALNEHGRHVILYLVARRDPHYFPPDLVDYLQQGDNTETSKKPGDVKVKELLSGILDPLLNAIIEDTQTWLSNNSVVMTTLAILKTGSGEKLKEAFESIAKYITNLDTKIVDAGKEYALVEHVGLHMALKKLIQHDKVLQETPETTFGEILVNYLTKKVIKKWITYNRGCFLIITLLENEAKAVVDNLSEKLQSISSQLESLDSPGAKILIKKLR